MRRMNTPQDLDSACLLLCFAWAGDGRKLPRVGHSPAGITADTPLSKLPWLLVRSALWQLLSNLLQWRDANDREALHQARIGWRRLRSTQRLLRKIDGLPLPPPTAALEPLMASLGAARDVEVARQEVLPGLQRICQQAAQPLPDEWLRLMAKLDSQARRHTKALQLALKGRMAGRALWELVLWLEQLAHFELPVNACAAAQGARHWVHHRLDRLHTRFQSACSQASDPQRQHRSRILAKRLRYASEDFAAFAQHKHRKWHKQALHYQSHIGLQRDAAMTIALAEQLGARRVAALLRETLIQTPGGQGQRGFSCPLENGN